MRSAILIALLFSTSAYAHDVWPDGSPVEDWVKQQCCGFSEAHRYDSGQVHEIADGVYLVDGYSHFVTRRPAPSPAHDNYWYLFYRTDWDCTGHGHECRQSQQAPVCWFAPMTF